MDITWKNFQLQQANNKEGEEWEVWSVLDHSKTRSLPAAIAGEAAMLQGQTHHNNFHLALLKARHNSTDRIALNTFSPLIDIAKNVGLDVPRFEEALKDPALVQNIARDHIEATEKHGVFGTPTFVFENGNSTYLKTFIPSEENCTPFFAHFVSLVRDMSFVGELKRPQPPWPKGVIG